MSGEGYLNCAIEAGSTANGYFALKLFPRHVHWFQIKFGFDLLDQLVKSHDAQVLLVEREDRIRQAVSFARALQSGRWASTQEKENSERCDFDLICRCYFTVERSYAFWKNYLFLKQIHHRKFVYEQLIGDPAAFIEAVASHAGVTAPDNATARYSIQRDGVSDDWRTRFIEDAKSHSILTAATPSRLPKRSLPNLVRFLRSKPMRPVPYAF